MNSKWRSYEVDVIRMFALIGICMVNVPFMALPVESVFIAPENRLDKTAAFIIECFFQMKFFILFSFIFGWGMEVQSRSAKSRGKSFIQLYFRRMFGLAVLGVAHAVFVFNGDILLLYAVLGSFLWFLQTMTPRQLIKVAVSMVPLSMILLTVLALIVDNVTMESSNLITASDGASLGGGFLEATQARFADWPVTFAFLVLLQGPLAFAAFAFGLAAAKSDLFSEASDGVNLLQRRVPVLLIIALPLNALYAAVVGGLVPESREYISLLGFVMVAIVAPALPLVYLYFFIWLARNIKVPEILVLAGRNSLSSYVAQGVLAGVLFGAYGFGLFNTVGHATLIPLSFAIALSAMLITGSFASAFGRGPLEPVLRRISGKL